MYGTHFSDSVHSMNNVLENNDNSLNIGARDELRLRVPRVLEANPELSQRQLASGLGVSTSGVNYALKALVERGFVKADNFRKSGNKRCHLDNLEQYEVPEER